MTGFGTEPTAAGSKEIGLFGADRRSKQELLGR